MTNCVVVFFFKNEQQSGKNFEIVLILKQNNLKKKSVAHIKLTFCFQIQVHGMGKNIERQQGIIIKLMYTAKYVGPKCFSLQ